MKGGGGYQSLPGLVGSWRNGQSVCRAGMDVPVGGVVEAGMGYHTRREENGAGWGSAVWDLREKGG